MPYQEKPRTSHPSQGQVVVVKSSYGGQGTALYGSDNLHTETVSMEFHESEHHMEHGHNYRYAAKTVFEVELTALQWAEMVSSFGNGSGTPCTFRRRADLADVNVEKYSLPVSNNDKLQGHLADALADGVSALRAAQKALEEAVNAKGPVSKKSLEALRTHLIIAANNLGPNVNYIQKIFSEEVEQKMGEARMEIEAYMRNRVVDAGLEALGAPVREMKSIESK